MLQSNSSRSIPYSCSTFKAGWRVSSTSPSPRVQPDGIPTVEHQRIDEGVKRGARHPHKRPAKRPEHNGSIPADLNPDAVLERYLTESTTSQIAYEYGVNRKTLVGWLLEHRPLQWKRVQVIRAMCRKDDGNEGIEVSCDAFSLARAREMVRSGQWDLERLDASNYGPKQEVTHTGAVPVFVVNAPMCRVIDAEPVAEPQQSAIAAPLIEVSK